MAARQAGRINPLLRGRVLGLTRKLGEEEEEGEGEGEKGEMEGGTASQQVSFDAAFWLDTDLVVTALVRSGSILFCRFVLHCVMNGN